MFPGLVVPRGKTTLFELNVSLGTHQGNYRNPEASIPAPMTALVSTVTESGRAETTQEQAAVIPVLPPRFGPMRAAAFHLSIIS